MERRLTAILAADVVGYSRLMGANESGTVTALETLRSDFINPKIGEHQGRIVKLTGDGMLVEFPSVVNAVACAAEVQRGVRDRNKGVPPDRRIEFRIGVNVGDVIVQGEDILGDGVNVAARLESIAPPGGITISGPARDHLGNRLDLTFEDMGEQAFKKHREAGARLPRHSRSRHCSGQRHARWSSAAGKAVDRRPALQQHEWRPGTGILQRWDYRGHNYRLVQYLRTLRCRAQYRVHLQRQAGKSAASGSRAWREIYPGRKCAKSQLPRARYRTVDQRQGWWPRLGRSV